MLGKINFQTLPNNPRINSETFNAIYDKEFVKLINGLSDSIKEFCKVVKNNISESFRCLNSSKFITEQAIIILKNMNMNNQEGLNALFQKIEMLSKNTKNFEENLNYSSKSITLFFNDVKYLVNQIKNLRKKNLSEADFYTNNRSTSPNMTIRKDLNNNKNSDNNKKQLNYICSDVLTTLKNFGNNLIYSFDIKKLYDEMVSSIKIKLDKLINMPSSDRSIIKNINSQINKLTNTNNINYRSKSPLLTNKLKYRIENVNQNNKSYETQIKELKEQIKIFKQENQILENKLKTNRNNNNLYINNNQSRINGGPSNYVKKFKKNEDNLNYSSPSVINLNKNNVNINNNINNQLLMKKDNEIMLYKNKLNFCQNRIIMLITELNKIKQENIEKSNNTQKYQNINNNKRYSYDKENEMRKVDSQQEMQYEETINELCEEISKYKNIINMDKNKISQLENQIQELKINNSNLFNKNYIENNNNKSKFNSIDNNNIINKLQKELQFKNNQILKLNNQIKIIVNDRNRLNIQLQSYVNGSPNNNNFQYENEIQELNNQIMDLNKIIEEKDYIINQQSDLKLQKFDDNDVSLLIQENNNLKQELLKYTNNKNLKTDFDILMKENQEYKKQFEELQDKFIKTKIFYEENLTNLQDNIENKDLLNKLTECKNLLLNTELERDKLTKELNELKNNNNKFNIANNTNNNNELIKKINELSSNLKTTQDSKNKLEIEIKKKNEELEGLQIFIKKLEKEREKLDISILSQNDKGEKIPLEKYTNVLNKLNDAEKKILILQKTIKDLQNKLEKKEIQDMATYRSEDFYISNYEEEFDLRKMIRGAKIKNRSEDFNIDYPNLQGVKEKQKQLKRKLKMLEEQIKILLYNINCSGKIKPTVMQICQLMGLDNEKIEMVISGKGKKNTLEIFS